MDQPLPRPRANRPPPRLFLAGGLVVAAVLMAVIGVLVVSAGGGSDEPALAIVGMEPSPTASATRVRPTAVPTARASATQSTTVRVAQSPTQAPLPPTVANEPPTIAPPPIPSSTSTAVPAPPPPPPPLPPPGSLAGMRIYTNGDSTSYFMSVGLQSLAVAQGAVQVQPAAEYQISSGLLGGNSFDWYAYLASEMATYTPDVVVFMIGANDAHVGMDIAAYRARVGQMMDQLGSKRVIWVGQPNMGRPDLAASVPGLNQAFIAEAATRPWVRYVDTWGLTSDVNGNFTPYLPDGTLARGADGVHFTSAGGLYLAHAVVAAIAGG